MTPEERPPPPKRKKRRRRKKGGAGQPADPAEEATRLRLLPRHQAWALGPIGKKSSVCKMF